TAAFHEDDLHQFATERLAFEEVKVVDQVYWRQPKSPVVFSLVGVCEKYGHLPELVLAIGEARPSRDAGKALLEDFGLAAAAAWRPVTVEIPEGVHEAVIRFNKKFQQWREQIGYLNANKKLHDLLHRLQDFQAQIESTVRAIRWGDREPPDR